MGACPLALFRLHRYPHLNSTMGNYFFPKVTHNDLMDIGTGNDNSSKTDQVPSVLWIARTAKRRCGKRAFNSHHSTRLPHARANANNTSPAAFVTTSSAPAQRQ
jgi:uncharacterized protein (DUF2461 family)